MKEKKEHGWKLQMLLLAVILIIVAVCIIKLIIWNKSGNIVLEDIAEGTYDYESLDMVFTVDPDNLAGREDDGVNTVLIIGNSFPVIAPGGKSIADMIDSMDDTDVITLSAYAGKISDEVNAYNTEKTYWQAANLYEIADALCTGDYSLQKEALEHEVHVNQNLYDTITSIDMDKVDTLFILYDSVDYTSKSSLYDPDNKFNTGTYEGALRASITEIQSTFPYIRIIVGSPFLHGVVGDETVDAATLVNYGNGNLSEYVMRQYNIAMECCVSYVDNYFGLITEETMNYYCNVNELSAEGVELIGNHIVEYLMKKY